MSGYDNSLLYRIRPPQENGGKPREAVFHWACGTRLTAPQNRNFADNAASEIEVIKIRSDSNGYFAPANRLELRHLRLFRKRFSRPRAVGSSTGHNPSSTQSTSPWRSRPSIGSQPHPRFLLCAKAAPRPTRACQKRREVNRSNPSQRDSAASMSRPAVERAKRGRKPKPIITHHAPDDRMDRPTDPRCGAGPSRASPW